MVIGKQYMHFLDIVNETLKRYGKTRTETYR